MLSIMISLSTSAFTIAFSVGAEISRYDCDTRVVSRSRILR